MKTNRAYAGYVAFHGHIFSSSIAMKKGPSKAISYMIMKALFILKKCIIFIIQNIQGLGWGTQY